MLQELMLAWIYFPTIIFSTIFLATTAPVSTSGGKAGQSGSEAVSAMARGDNPCSLCMRELDTLGGRIWNLSPSKPGSQVLLMLLPLVQALTNLLEPQSSITALCVEVLQCGRHRLESKNYMDSFHEQSSGVQNPATDICTQCMITHQYIRQQSYGG